MATAPAERARLPYDAHAVEERWRKRWAEAGCFRAGARKGAPKWFNFDGGPFPNGALHMGHLRTFALGDVSARYRRMAGHDVLHCFEFDAFGLPNELAAEEAGRSPAELTGGHIALMREQMSRLGFSYDWDHVHVTCDPRWYRWTQWLFVKLYEHGLVYRAEAPLNFCPSCDTTLAHMQVEDGRCWRCDTPVERRRLPQWFVRLSAYTGVLEETLDDLDGWSPQVRGRIRAILGRSDGFDADFEVTGGGAVVTAFAPDRATLAGATALLAAPSSPALETLLGRERAREIERADVGRAWRRRGGASDGEPRSDSGVRVRLRGAAAAPELPLLVSAAADPWFANGIVVVGGGRGRADLDAGAAVRPAVHHRVRDWLVSRQRRWGTPMPVVVCERCGHVPLPEKRLPVLLDAPPQADCPRCGGAAERERDTLDCYFDVVWCFLACASRLGDDFSFTRADFEPWLPVDWFHNGVDSLYYAHLYRFIGRALYDIGVLVDPEPIRRYHGHGTVLSGGRKMSKHSGTAVALDDLLDEYGSDVLRLYVLWAASPLKGIEWRVEEVDDARRFAAAVWELVAPRAEAIARFAVGDAAAGAHAGGGKPGKAARHTARRVTQLLERYRISGCVQELHLLRGRLAGFADARGLDAGGDWDPIAGTQFSAAVHAFLVLLAPFAPHLAEELGERCGGTGLVALADWPLPG